MEKTSRMSGHACPHSRRSSLSQLLNPADTLVALQDASKTGRDSKGAGAEEGGEPGPDAALDARLTAGVVELYTALLKEPIPEEMLRLVEKLSKRERK